MAESLTKSSGSLVAANGTLEEAVALTAAANTIIQDADVVGTALKTVAMRLRGTSVTELEEEGLDTEGAIESVSKLQSKIQALSGVNILTDTGSYKSTYEILSEIAEVWENINDMNQAALLELLAGKRAGSAMAAILENPDILKDAFESASDASGSALKENETYLDSIQGRIDLFTNAVQTMWQDTLDSEVVKWFVDIGTWLIKLINGVDVLGVRIGGLIPTLLTAVSVYIMLKNKMNPIEFFGSISNSIRGVATRFVNFGKSIKVSMTGATTATSTMTTATLKQAVANGTLTQSEAIRQATTNGLILSQVSLTDAEAMSLLSTTTLNEAEKQAIISKLGLSSAATTLTMATLGQAVAEGKITAAEAAHLGVATGLMAAQTSLTATKATEILTSQGLSAAHAQELVGKLGLTEATTTLNVAKIQQLMIDGALTSADGALAISLLATGTAAKGAAAGFTALWTAMWPMLAVMAGIAAIYGIVKLFDALYKTSEELGEELSNLKAEISELESEIDSINSELETMQERMAELLAMPSLSLIEQEELSKLQLQTAELERQLELKGLLLKDKEADHINKAKKWINNAWNGTDLDKKYWVSGNGTIGRDELLTSGVSGKTALNKSLPKYDELKQQIPELEKLYISAQEEFDQNGKMSKGTFDQLWKVLKDAGSEYISNYNLGGAHEANLGDMATLLNRYQGQLDVMGDGIEMVLGDMSRTISEHELSYSMGDEDINKFLDEYYAYQYAYQKAQGIDNTSSVIASIFDDTSSDAIKKLKEDLTEIAGDDTLDATTKQKKALSLVNSAISSASDEYDRLKTSMDVVGISADNVAQYFIQLSEAPDSSTVEGLTTQYQKGVDALSKYKGKATDIIAEFTNLDGQVENITWGSLFDDNGETIDTQISKVLYGADETARKEFARIAEAVNNGTMSVEKAMTSFSGSGLVAVSKLIEESFGELNKSVFKDLEDDISGFIDTFSEFSAALEDVANSMELLNTAQEQFDNSGQVSVKTALELVESTDRWNEILYVENGQIKLNANAQDILAQSKLDTVKANLAEAKASIQNQLAQLGAADATLLSAEASDITTEAYTIYTNAMNSYTASIAGFGAALGALIEGRWGDVIGDFKSAYDATKEVKTYENNTNIEGLRNRLAEVETMEDFFGSVDTVEEFEDNYDFDKTPGDKSGDKEREDDAFQKEMDYWENRLSANQSRADRLQNEIDLLEQKGMKASAQYYRDQMTLLNSVNPDDGFDSKLELLNGKLAAVVARLGETTEGSEEWWEAAQEYNDIVNEIQAIESELVDLQDAIGEIDTYKFEEFNTRLDNLISKLGTIRDLIAPDSEEDWFDDEGNWTEEGVAVLGTYIQELEMYKQGLEETKSTLSTFNKIGNGADWSKLTDEQKELYANEFGIHSEQEYYDKQEELISQQYDYMSSISDTEQSIVDMYESSIDAVEEYTETLIDSYGDYIDSVKEALDAERDLYDFKKNVQKQSKDIAAIERRIMSLSGSTNAADIAERRKLESDLYSAREELNDTYYDHARSAQDTALDAEQTAYEESMTKFIEGLRVSLDEATLNMDEFLMGVTSMVMYNADTVLTKYQETNLPLTDELTNPWVKAKEAVGNYSGDALNMMNEWTKDGGFFAQFNATGTKNLQSPWSAGSTAASTFKTSVSTVMEGVVSNISTNVKTASTKLSELYQQIKDTEQSVSNVNLTPSGNGGGGGGGADNAPSAPTESDVTLRKLMQMSQDKVIGSQAKLNTYTTVVDGVKYYKDFATGYYYKISDLKKRDGNWIIPKGAWFYTANPSVGDPNKRDTTLSSGRTKNFSNVLKYAKGTTGTTRDEWAITDEPWLGDELVLVPTAQGNLSYMRKGTGVVPADLTANLMEWGQFTPDTMNLGSAVNVNMISNAVNKPEFNFAFDALVKAENITEETLPAVKKLVTQELNRFTRELNYAIKGKGGR